MLIEMIFILSKYTCVPYMIILYTFYNMLCNFRKYHLYIILSMINWLVYGFKGFIYINILNISSIILLNYEKIKKTYINIKNILNINISLHDNITNDITDDITSKELKQLKSFHNILTSLENYIQKTCVFLKDLFIRMKNNINKISYYQKYVTKIKNTNIIYYISSFINQIKLNIILILNLFIEIDSYSENISKYKNIYNKINKSKKNNNTTNLENMSEILNNLNEMITTMNAIQNVNNINDFTHMKEINLDETLDNLISNNSNKFNNKIFK